MAPRQLDRGLQVAAGVAPREHLLGVGGPGPDGRPHGHGGDRQGDPHRHRPGRDQRRDADRDRREDHQHDGSDDRLPEPHEGEQATGHGTEQHPDGRADDDAPEEPSRERLAAQQRQVGGVGGQRVAAGRAAAHRRSRYRS